MHQHPKTRLPENMRYLFWDTNFDELYLQDYPEYIAERIMMFGDDFSLKYMIENIDVEILRKLVYSSRALDNKTRNYWSIILDGKEFTPENPYEFPG